MPGRTGGAERFSRTFSDNIGIRGLLRAFAILKGLDGLPELWNPDDFEECVLQGDLNVCSPGGPKANRFTGQLVRKFFEKNGGLRPSFDVIADQASPDLRSV